MAGLMRKREGQGRELSQTSAREPSRQTTIDPFRMFAQMDPFRRMREMLSFDPFAELEPTLPMMRQFAPDMEVRETKDAFVISADLPGLREEDVQIDVSGNRLTISGKREEERRDEGERYYAYERSYGSFTRSFMLPEGIDPDKIDARLDSGVLEVHIPKSAMEQSKRIHVRRAGGAEETTTQSDVRPFQGAQGGAAEEGATHKETEGGVRDKAA
jgi:HSP20 family protein